MKKLLILFLSALLLWASESFSQTAGKLTVNKPFLCPLYVQLIGGPTPCSSSTSIVFTQTATSAVYMPGMAGWPPSYFISGVRIYNYDPGTCGSFGTITYGLCPGMVTTSFTFAGNLGSCSGSCVQYFGKWYPETSMGGMAVLNCTYSL